MDAAEPAQRRNCAEPATKLGLPSRGSRVRTPVVRSSIESPAPRGFSLSNRVSGRVLEGRSGAGVASPPVAQQNKDREAEDDQDRH